MNLIIKLIILLQYAFIFSNQPIISLGSHILCHDFNNKKFGRIVNYILLHICVKIQRLNQGLSRANHYGGGQVYHTPLGPHHQIWDYPRRGPGTEREWTLTHRTTRFLTAGQGFQVPQRLNQGLSRANHYGGGQVYHTPLGPHHQIWDYPRRGPGTEREWTLTHRTTRFLTAGQGFQVPQRLNQGLSRANHYGGGQVYHTPLGPHHQIWDYPRRGPGTEREWTLTHRTTRFLTAGQGFQVPQRLNQGLSRANHYGGGQVYHTPLGPHHQIWDYPRRGPGTEREWTLTHRTTRFLTAGQGFQVPQRLNQGLSRANHYGGGQVYHTPLGPHHQIWDYPRRGPGTEREWTLTHRTTRFLTAGQGFQVPQRLNQGLSRANHYGGGQVYHTPLGPHHQIWDYPRRGPGTEREWTLTHRTTRFLTAGQGFQVPQRLNQGLSRANHYGGGQVYHTPLGPHHQIWDYPRRGPGTEREWTLTHRTTRFLTAGQGFQVPQRLNQGLSRANHYGGGQVYHTPLGPHHQIWDYPRRGPGTEREWTLTHRTTRFLTAGQGFQVPQRLNQGLSRANHYGGGQVYHTPLGPHHQIWDYPRRGPGTEREWTLTHRTTRFLTAGQGFQVPQRLNQGLSRANHYGGGQVYHTPLGPHHQIWDYPRRGPGTEREWTLTHRTTRFLTAGQGFQVPQRLNQGLSRANHYGGGQVYHTPLGPHHQIWDYPRRGPGTEREWTLTHRTTRFLTAGQGFQVPQRLNQGLSRANHYGGGQVYHTPLGPHHQIWDYPRRGPGTEREWTLTHRTTRFLTAGQGFQVPQRLNQGLSRANHYGGGQVYHTPLGPHHQIWDYPRRGPGTEREWTLTHRTTRFLTAGQGFQVPQRLNQGLSRANHYGGGQVYHTPLGPHHQIWDYPRRGPGTEREWTLTHRTTRFLTAGQGFQVPQRLNQGLSRANHYGGGQVYHTPLGPHHQIWDYPRRGPGTEREWTLTHRTTRFLTAGQGFQVPQRLNQGLSRANHYGGGQVYHTPLGPHHQIWDYPRRGPGTEREWTLTHRTTRFLTAGQGFQVPQRLNQGLSRANHYGGGQVYHTPLGPHHQIWDYPRRGPGTEREWTLTHRTTRFLTAGQGFQVPQRLNQGLSRANHYGGGQVYHTPLGPHHQIWDYPRRGPGTEREWTLTHRTTRFLTAGQGFQVPQRLNQGLSRANHYGGGQVYHTPLGPHHQIWDYPRRGPGTEREWTLTHRTTRFLTAGQGFQVPQRLNQGLSRANHYGGGQVYHTPLGPHHQIWDYPRRGPGTEREWTLTHRTTRFLTAGQGFQVPQRLNQGLSRANHYGGGQVYHTPLGPHHQIWDYPRRGPGTEREWTLTHRTTRFLTAGQGFQVPQRLNQGLSRANHYGGGQVYHTPLGPHHQIWDYPRRGPGTEREWTLTHRTTRFLTAGQGFQVPQRLNQGLSRANHYGGGQVYHTPLGPHHQIWDYPRRGPGTEREWTLTHRTTRFLTAGQGFQVPQRLNQGLSRANHYGGGQVYHTPLGPHHQIWDYPRRGPGTEREWTLTHRTTRFLTAGQGFQVPQRLNQGLSRANHYGGGQVYHTPLGPHHQIWDYPRRGPGTEREWTLTHRTTRFLTAGQGFQVPQRLNQGLSRANHYGGGQVYHTPLGPHHQIWDYPRRGPGTEREWTLTHRTTRFLTAGQGFQVPQRLNQGLSRANHYGGGQVYHTPLGPHHQIWDYPRRGPGTEREWTLTHRTTRFLTAGQGFQVPQRLNQGLSRANHYGGGQVYHTPLGPHHQIWDYPRRGPGTEREWTLTHRTTRFLTAGQGFQVPQRLNQGLSRANHYGGGQVYHTPLGPHHQIWDYPRRGPGTEREWTLTHRTTRFLTAGQGFQVPQRLNQGLSRANHYGGGQVYHTPLGPHHQIWDYPRRGPGTEREWTLTHRTTRFLTAGQGFQVPQRLNQGLSRANHYGGGQVYHTPLGPHHQIWDYPRRGPGTEREWTLTHRTTRFLTAGQGFQVPQRLNQGLSRANHYGGGQVYHTPLGPHHQIWDYPRRGPGTEREWTLTHRTTRFLTAGQGFQVPQRLNQGLSRANHYGGGQVYHTPLGPHHQIWDYPRRGPGTEREWTLTHRTTRFLTAGQGFQVPQRLNQGLSRANHYGGGQVYHTPLGPHHQIWDYPRRGPGTEREWTLTHRTTRFLTAGQGFQVPQRLNQGLSRANHYGGGQVYHTPLGPHHQIWDYPRRGPGTEREWTLTHRTTRFLTAGQGFQVPQRLNQGLSRANHYGGGQVYHTPLGPHHQIWDYPRRGPGTEREWTLTHRTTRFLTAGQGFQVPQRLNQGLSRANHYGGGQVYHTPLGPHHQIWDYPRRGPGTEREWTLTHRTTRFLTAGQGFQVPQRLNQGLSRANHYGGGQVYHTPLGPHHQIWDYPRRGPGTEREWTLTHRTTRFLTAGQGFQVPQRLNQGLSRANHYGGGQVYHTPLGPHHQIWDYPRRGPGTEREWTLTHRTTRFLTAGQGFQVPQRLNQGLSRANHYGGGQVYHTPLGPHHQIWDYPRRGPGTEREWTLTHRTTRFLTAGQGFQVPQRLNQGLSRANHYGGGQVYHTPLGPHHQIWDYPRRGPGTEREWTLTHRTTRFLTAGQGFQVPQRLNQGLSRANHYGGGQVYHTPLGPHHQIWDYPRRGPGTEREWTLTHPEISIKNRDISI